MLLKTVFQYSPKDKQCSQWRIYAGFGLSSHSSNAIYLRKSWVRVLICKVEFYFIRLVYEFNDST